MTRIDILSLYSHKQLPDEKNHAILSWAIGKTVR